METILVAIFGIFVTLFLAMLKFNRDRVTKLELKPPLTEKKLGQK